VILASPDHEENKMRVILALFLCVLLAGCATGPQVPPLPLIELKSGGRIGVLVEGGSFPFHSHIAYSYRGISPSFPSFDREYSYRWNLQPKVTSTISDALRDSGFSVIDLLKEGYSYDDVAGLVVQASNEWNVLASKISAFRTLKERLGIKAVVLLKESRVTVLLDCLGASPCVERYMSTSGLYTQSAYGLTKYYAVAAFTWNVFVLDPVADVAQGIAVSKVLKTPKIVIRDFAKPANFENITEAEFEPVREAVMKIIENDASVVVAALKNGSQ
jgi:hypothetical protein